MVKSKSNATDIETILMSKPEEIIAEVNNLRKAIKGEDNTPETDPTKTLSKLNRQTFLTEARATLKKYGYALPPENEDTYLGGYELAMGKPLNDKNYPEFLENLKKFSDVEVNETRIAYVRVYEQYLKDKIIDKSEKGLLSETSTGFKVTTGLSYEGLIEDYEKVPGMERAVALLKANVSAENIKFDELLQKNPGENKFTLILNEVMVTALVDEKKVPVIEASLGAAKVDKKTESPVDVVSKGDSKAIAINTNDAGKSSEQPSKPVEGPTGNLKEAVVNNSNGTDKDKSKSEQPNIVPPVVDPKAVVPATNAGKSESIQPAKTNEKVTSDAKGVTDKDKSDAAAELAKIAATTKTEGGDKKENATKENGKNVDKSKTGLLGKPTTPTTDLKNNPVVVASKQNEK